MPDVRAFRRWHS